MDDSSSRWPATYRTPSANDCRIGRCATAARAGARIAAAAAIEAAKVTVSNQYAAATPYEAMTMPPSAGPTTAALWYSI